MDVVAFFVTALWAEQVDSVAHKQVLLDEVVIQSFKQEGDLKELPVAATVVNGTVIRNRNITGIKGIEFLCA